jgi:transposase
MPTGGPRPKYAQSVRETVESCLRAGVDVQQIAEEVHVSHQWVYFLRQNLDAFDTVSPPPLSVQGRPRKITKEAEEGILDFIEQNPTAYQDEIAEFLLSEYGIEAHRTTVCRALKRLNQTHKRTEKANDERDDNARADWRARLCQYKANQIVFVDESAANERTKDRRWGWSLRGLPCRVRQSSQRSTRWSILPAMGLNGYLDYDIIHGSFDSERFSFFIRQLLRKMTPFPGPRSVLVMDNCRTHHGDDIEEMCRQAGVRLEYLPTYSPDYNGIEESFSELKSWMRRNRELVPLFNPFFEGYMHLAVSQCCNAQKARGYFKSASVDVSDEDCDVDYSELI